METFVSNKVSNDTQNRTVLNQLAEKAKHQPQLGKGLRKTFEYKRCLVTFLTHSYCSKTKNKRHIKIINLYSLLNLNCYLF